MVLLLAAVDPIASDARPNSSSSARVAVHFEANRGWSTAFHSKLPVVDQQLMDPRIAFQTSVWRCPDLSSRYSPQAVERMASATSTGGSAFVTKLQFYSDPQFPEDHVLFERFFRHAAANPASHAAGDRSEESSSTGSPPLLRGVFVELGAANGETLSTTRFFEEYLDWRGVIIEPQPLNALRAITVRPKTAVFGMLIPGRTHCECSFRY